MEENLNVIQDLHSLISPHLPCDKSRILTVKYSRFSNDGYGLTILKLSIELVNNATGENWTLKALAKVLPIRHDVKNNEAKSIFVSEIGIHTLGQNTINLFLKEKGDKADFLLYSFGGRLNLNGSNVIDNNAVLILEDCEAGVCGSIIDNRTVSTQSAFNLEITKIILKTLAKFHTSTLAFKLQKPEDFKSKILPFLNKFIRKSNFDEFACAYMIKILKNGKVSINIIERAVVTFNTKYEHEVREPCATFCHGNLWIENILVKSTSKNPEIKLINLQESHYNSPLTDLLYFLFSSVQLEVLQRHLDDLIEFYYCNMQNFLKRFDEAAFSRNLFNQDLLWATKSQFYKTIIHLYDSLDKNFEEDPSFSERLCFIVKEFNKRDWLTL